MAEEIKQIKVGDTTYNIEPYTSYITLYTKQDDISGRKTFTGGVKISGRYQNSGDDEGLIIGRAANNYAGLCLGDPGGVRSVFYLNPSNSALWRYYNGSATYDITHPGKAGTIALTSDITTAIGNIIDSEETYKTFKKVAEYIAEDKTGTADMMGRISANEKNISTNQTNIRTIQGYFTDGVANKASWLNTNTALTYGASGLNYFNISGTAGNTKANNTPTSAWYHILRMNHGNSAGYLADIAVPLNDVNGVYWRQIRGGSFYGWYKFLDSNNYTSYTLALDGSNTMTGKLNLKATGANDTNIGNNGIRWGANSLPQDTAPEFVCTIDSFANGGRQKWADITSLATSLGLGNYVTLNTQQTITGIKDFDEEVYFNSPVEFYSSIWTSGQITTENSLLVSGDITGEGGLTISGDTDIRGDANIGGDANINGQIIGRCLLNSTAVTLSNSSSIWIPLNTSQVKIGTSPSYLHRGPTGTYKVVFPSSSCQVVTSSTSNMGSATYKVGSTTATESNLSGTAQGGGAYYNASVKIPTKTLTVTLTYGSSYRFSVTYTTSSYIKSVTSYGVYASEGIYAYPSSSSYPQGTIGIGVGGSGSPYVYRGQTNIGGESNSSYEVILGAAGKTYTYLSSPTGTWSYASDKRDKTDIELINSSLHFINKLQPVTYVENMRENYINEDGTFNQESHQMGVLKKHRRRAGFLAQDVYELLKKEYGTDNYASVVDYNRYKKEDEGVFDRYSFNGVQLIPFLVKAIQEQQDIIESLEEKINLLEEKIQKEVN